MDLPGLAVHPGTAVGISSDLVPYLTALGGPLAFAIAAYYAVKAAIFLLATVVAIYTKNEERRKACLEIVQALSRGWPLPGPQG